MTVIPTEHFSSAASETPRQRPGFSLHGDAIGNDLHASPFTIRRRLSSVPIWTDRADAHDREDGNGNLSASVRLASAVRHALQARVSLVEADLPGVALPGTDIATVNLAGANLAHADFSHANLSDCNLAEAILVGANLTGTNLTGANLAGANLAGAMLVGAIVDGATMIDCILDDADLSDTDLAHANLAAARGIIDAGWPGGQRCLGWMYGKRAMVFLGDRSRPLDQNRNLIDARADREAGAALAYLEALATLRGWC